MFTLLRRLLRLSLIIVLILLGIILSSIIFFPLLYRFLPRHVPAFAVCKWSYYLCKICGLRVHLHGQPAATPVLMVANHISWLDIFALLSTFYVKFVSKSEIGHWPVIGYLSQRVGTLFIRRGQSEAMKVATQLMVKTLKNQERVLFFPEGTSSNGQQVLRFHARLFQAALDGHVIVQPIALRYSSGDSISTVAPFIDDDDFVSHLWRVLGEPSLDIYIYFLPILEVEGKKRREIADAAYHAITGKLGITNVRNAETISHDCLEDS